MKLVEFNKENWSGESTLVRIFKGGLFKIDSYKGYRFRLQPIKVTTDLDEEGYQIVGDGFTGPLGTVWEGRLGWMAYQDGIERSADDKFVAAAKLISNIL